MLITIIRKNQMLCRILPQKVSGKYWLSSCEGEEGSSELIAVEAVNGQWVLKSNGRARIKSFGDGFLPELELVPNLILDLSVKGVNEPVKLFTEPITPDRSRFVKYSAKGRCSVSIGRSKCNSLVFDNKFVSGEHAELVFDGEKWAVADKGSGNGTFVNNTRIERACLKPGDFISLMGLKIIIGSNFIAVNNPDGLVCVQSEGLAEYIPIKRIPVGEDEEAEEESCFYRSPRFFRSPVKAELHIDPPPAQEKPDTVPLALMLGPAITMGMTSVSTGMISFTNAAQSGNIASALPTLIMSGGMLAGTVLWPTLTKKHEKKQKLALEKKRQNKYFGYLEGKRDEIKRCCKEQSEILSENIIPPSDCAKRAIEHKRSLWERTAEQEDFLRLRLGKGVLPLFAEVKCPEKKFTLNDDNLYDAMLALGNEPKLLSDVPISVSLLKEPFVGITGKRPKVISFAYSLLVQLAALHSYDELKLVFITSPGEAEKWEAAKRLPHIWNNEKTVRFFAAEDNEIKELSSVLDRILVGRAEEKSSFLPHFVIVAADKSAAARCESLGKILAAPENAGFSVIMLYDELKELPKETCSVIELDGENSRLVNRNDTSGSSVSFSAEAIDGDILELSAFALANTRLDLSGQRGALADKVGFLEMFGAGKIEHLNALTRWKENNPVRSLQTPVGTDADGGLFMLDLHEKYHGPHGLVAGMTGSGKSEFIITYILSLAVNYHPDEVSFVLIDYKGGGLAGAFENTDTGVKLPHLAGTITNLDGASINRSLISIQSELRRRQLIFSNARKASNEGTMDIYKYQQMYRDGIVSVPVPHLMIICDEFAELKTQRPEFMEQLISAARIGRSLGVHLILATQKPAGVVDDQIWSNSKFRVCLKVQEKADSMDMIKCPDAAELTQTGRFYLQVGFNELFRLGQSAWSGENYIPSDTVRKKTDNSVQLIDNLGRTVKEIKPAVKAETGFPKRTQIVAIVKYLAELAGEENISVRPLWEPPIPPRIFVDELEAKYGYKPAPLRMQALVGEYDDPFNQVQNPLILDYGSCGNVLVFGSAGNGKTTFVSACIYSIIKHRSADEANIYILDFDAGTLKAFSGAPQIGGVFTVSDAEETRSLFKMLSEEIERRRALFSGFGGDFAAYCASASEKLPEIMVFINNFSGFCEAFEELGESFFTLSRDGVKYGVYFTVTAVSGNAVRYKVMQNFGRILTMQLNDPSDYPVLLGKTNGLVPSKCKGRGLVVLENVYEFQTAFCFDCDDQYEFIRSVCESLKAESASFARRIPVMPETVDSETDFGNISLAKLPVGIKKNDFSAAFVNAENKYILPVCANDGELLREFAGELVKILKKQPEKLTVLSAESDFAGKDTEKLVEEAYFDIAARNNAYKDAGYDAAALDGYAKNVFVIYGLKRLLSALSDDGAAKLKELLEKGSAVYKVSFILIDTAQSLSAFSYEPWYKTYLGCDEGLWLGGGFTDQYVIKARKVTPELFTDPDEGYGYTVLRGKPILTRFAGHYGEAENE